jgi:hypothetical protein
MEEKMSEPRVLWTGRHQEGGIVHRVIRSRAGNSVACEKLGGYDAMRAESWVPENDRDAVIIFLKLAILSLTQEVGDEP